MQPISNHTQNGVVIVAAGRGTRFKGTDGLPKQYVNLLGQSVLQHTTSAFLIHPDIDIVQIVIHSDDQSLYTQSVIDHPKLLPPVLGGNTRQESCLAGLKALQALNVQHVLIHDGARPLLDDALINRVLESIKSGQCALPAIAVADTLKKGLTNEQGAIVVKETIKRENLYLAQTPQGFRLEEIMDAHEKAVQTNKNDFTDDASIAEWAGIKVTIVDGTAENIKITTIENLESVKKHMISAGNAIPDIRTGSGYDVHRLIPITAKDEGITLCGITIPFDKKLDGHSDADVGLHALTDALLGAICDGDIGSHFPPSDPKWKGASSDQFLAHACKLIGERNGTITHLDVTLICEEPKIGPHRDEMREQISKICNIDKSRIAVKATTNEQIGFIGRGEGIAALASATVVISA